MHSNYRLASPRVRVGARVRTRDRVHAAQSIDLHKSIYTVYSTDSQKAPNTEKLKESSKIS